MWIDYDPAAKVFFTRLGGERIYGTTLQEVADKVNKLMVNPVDFKLTDAAFDRSEALAEGAR